MDKCKVKTPRPEYHNCRCNKDKGHEGLHRCKHGVSWP